MTEGTLIRANLWRNAVRSTLLLACIFIAFLIFGMLVGASQGLRSRVSGAQQANFLVVSDRTSSSSPQPYAHFERVKRIEGVVDAAFIKWFGGYYGDQRNTWVTFGVDAVAHRRMLGDRFGMPDEQWRAFMDDRTGIVISEPVARANNVHIGQRIPLHSNIFTNKTTGDSVWTFTVRGTYVGTTGYGDALFHYDYFRETATFSANTVDSIMAETRSADENAAVARRIDAAFANSANETKTQDERSYNLAYLAQFGDLTRLITVVVVGAFLSILLIVGNTMVMAVRERTKEIGVLKTLGFTSGRVMRMVLAESLLLSLIGASAGLAMAALALLAINPYLGSIGPLYLPPLTALAGAGIAFTFGLATGIIPAVGAFNLKIVHALARK